VIAVAQASTLKASIRRHIAFAYGMMASIQLVTVFVTARPQVNVLLVLLLALLAGTVYVFLGQRVFQKTGQRVYQYGLTGMIMAFGALLLVQA
jgi:hypothetical protein